jgi:hypothetical protein
MADTPPPAGLHLDYKASNGLTYPVDAADEHQANQIADWIEERVKAGDPQLKGPQPFKIETMPKDGPPELQAPVAAPDGGKSFLDTGMGLMARHLVKGAVALPGLMLDAGANEAGATRNAIDELFDKAGARNDRQGDDGYGDRMVGSVVEGLGGLGTMGGVAAGTDAIGAKPVADVLKNAMGSQIVGTTTGSLASQAVAEKGGDWKAQMLAGILAGTAPSGIKTAVDATRRGVMRGTSPTAVRDAISTFAPAGETPTVGQAVGGHPAGVEAFLSQFFPSSSKVVNRYQEQEANIGKSLAAKADELYPPLSNTDMGAMISSEAHEGFKPNGRGMIDRAYDNLEKKLPSTTKVDATAFAKYLADKAAVDPLAKNITTNQLLGGGDQYKWAAALNDLNRDLKESPGGLPLSAIKELRTSIGRQIDNAAFDTAGGNISDLRGAYGVLSESMKDAAEKNGALDLYNKANGMSKDYHGVLETTQPILDKSGGFEQVFKAALGGMQEGGTKLQNTYYLMRPEARQAMTAQILRRAARPAAGDPEAFDMFKFAKNMGKMDEEAKNVIFDPKVVGPEFRSDIDNITETVRRIEEMKSKYGAATTPAQGRLGAQMMLGGILSGPVGLLTSAFLGSHAGVAGASAVTASTLGAAIGAPSVAKWMTNPKTVHWLAETTKLPTQQIPIAINQLEQDGAKQHDPEMVELAQYLKQRYALENQGDQ